MRGDRMQQTTAGRWRAFGLACALVGLGMVATVGMSSAAAEVLSPSEMPAVLKELPAAGTMCKRNAATPLADPAPPPSEVKPDLGCVRPLAELRSSLATAAKFDLRPRAQFDRFHLESAISISEADVMAKPYWRGQHIVLMGGAADDLRLARLCGRLAGQGYASVSVLQGGVMSLVASKEPMVGTVEPLSEMARIDTQTLWFLSTDASTLLLSGPSARSFGEELPGMVSLPALDARSLGVALRAASSRQGKLSRLRRVVVLSGGDVSEAMAREWTSVVGELTVLVYTLSREQFALEMRKLRDVWKAHERGPKRAACSG